MPIRPILPVDQPFVRGINVPDVRSLADMLNEQGRIQGQMAMARGQGQANTWAGLALAFNQYQQAVRERQMQSAVLQQRQMERSQDERLKRDEMAERKGEREAAEKLRQASEARLGRAEADRTAGEIADSVKFGPVAESQVDPLMASPVTAGRTRYSFGPGTAEGPELMPTPDQQRGIAVEDAIKKMGGQVGPNGQVVMPPKPPTNAAPNIGSFEDYVTAKFGPRPSPEQIESARRAYSDQARAPQQPKDFSGRIDRIGNNFKTESVVKKAQTMAEAVDFVKGLDANTKNPADDQALIYAFAKAMDPDSVVREGEYATVQKYSQSFADKFGFDVKRIFSNTVFLTPEARKNMKNTIEARFAPVKKQYNNLHKTYADRINKITGQQDGTDFLSDYAASFPEDPGQPKKNPNR